MKEIQSGCRHIGRHIMNLRLEIRNRSDKGASINLRVTLGRGMQWRYATGYSLKRLEHWNKTTQKVRNVAGEPAAVMNYQLQKLLLAVNEAYAGARREGEVQDKAFFKGVVDAFRAGEGELSKRKAKWTLSEAFDQFITYQDNPDKRHNGKRVKASTLKTYRGTLNLLNFYKAGTQAVRSVDMDWYNDFCCKCEAGGRDGLPLSANYIGKCVKNVKRVLRFSEESGQEVHPAFKSRSFEVLSEQVESIYLTEDEIDLLLTLDLSGASESLRVSRDLFIVGCYTGLRVSDYQRLSREHIVDCDGVSVFRIRAQKTGVEVFIPIHPKVNGILAQYGGDTPPFQHEQVLNRNLKELGLLAGIDRKEKVQRTRGGQLVTDTVMRCDLMQSHTARRSFCTNAYKAGVDTLQIMAISGHKTQENFLRYIRVTREEQAVLMSRHIFFKQG